jgi:hypothetical protein
LIVSQQLNEVLEAPQLDPLVLAVANEYLSGKSISEIAENFNLTMDRVSAICEHGDVKAYVNSVYLSQGYLNRTRRLQLIERVIEAKLQEALETGVYSKRDLLDWMKMLHDMEALARPKDKGPAVAVQINNYDSLMKDLLK